MDAASDDDEPHMQRALALAERGAGVTGASPIGSVLVCDGVVIGEGHNEVDLRRDPTAHAEVVAIRAAGARLGQSRFPGATLYSTLQPCGMCSLACIWAGVTRVVYGAGRVDVHTMYFEDRHLDVDDLFADAVRSGLRITGGVLRGACAGLLYGPEDMPPAEEQANL